MGLPGGGDEAGEEVLPLWTAPAVVSQSCRVRHESGYHHLRQLLMLAVN